MQGFRMASPIADGLGLYRACTRRSAAYFGGRSTSPGNREWRGEDRTQGESDGGGKPGEPHGPIHGEFLRGGASSASAFSSQKVMPISRYIVAAGVRCSCAFAWSLVRW